MPEQLIGRHLLPGEENGWKLELYAVGPSAISTAPTYVYTSDDPGPVQGDIAWEYGGLGTLRGATLQTTEEVDWAPDAARGVRYAVRFYLRLAATGEHLRAWAGYVRDVTGGLGSGSLYTVQIGSLHDAHKEGARQLGYYAVPGWISGPQWYGAVGVEETGGTHGAYFDASVAPLAAGDHGVTAGGLTVVGHPGHANCTPVTLLAEVLHDLQYNGTEPPPYVSELVAQEDARFPITSLARARPSLLTPRRMGTARTTSVVQTGTRLTKVREYGINPSGGAVGSYYGVWNLGAWVNGSIRTQASDYDVHGVSFSRGVWMAPSQTPDERVRITYGIAVSTSSGGGSIGNFQQPPNPQANIPGLVDAKSETFELSGGMHQYMKVELSQDWLQNRGYSALYVWAWVVIGYTFTDAEPTGSGGQGLVSTDAEWKAAALERVPTGAVLDLPREYSYPFGTVGTWQAQTAGIVIPPAFAAVPDASQPVAASRVTYTPGQAVSAIQTGVTTWR